MRIVPIRSLAGYEALHPDDLYRDCLRDAEQGDLDSTLANMGTLRNEEFEHLLKVAEQVLERISPHAM